MVEVIVSFIICLIIFTISMRFILSVELTNNIKSKQQSVILMHNAIKLKKISTGHETDKIIMGGNIKIEVDTIPSLAHKGLNEVHVKILHADGRLLNSSNYYTKSN